MQAYQNYAKLCRKCQIILNYAENGILCEKLRNLTNYAIPQPPQLNGAYANSATIMSHISCEILAHPRRRSAILDLVADQVNIDG